MGRPENRVAVVTISDRCSQGIYEDKSGPFIINYLKNKAHEVVHASCIPDDFGTIEKCLVDLCDSDRVEVILTTGGTGFSGRDVTPEATKSILDKEAPGIVIYMISQGIKSTPFAALSRSAAGTRNSTLIINLPGSLKAVEEYMDIVEPLLNHIVDQLRGDRLRVRIKHCEVQEPAKPLLLTIKNPDEIMDNPHKLESCGSGFPHRKSPYEMIAIEKAIKIIFTQLKTNLELKSEMIEIKNDFDLYDRRLCGNIFSRVDVPPFPASIKDGYAVKSSDGSANRKVMSASVTAGLSVDTLAVDKGWCIRINTGAPVPEGADAVVQVEDTKVSKTHENGSEKEISIQVVPKSGQDIRKKGNDIIKGEKVLNSRTKIGPIELGLLASIGTASVSVYKRPKVAVLSTGDELKEPGDPLGCGSIYDANRITLISFLRRRGCEVIDLGIVDDEAKILEQKICSGLEKADILISTGGVSMGEKDILKQILINSFGCKIHFARVNLKPGKPTTFATCSTLGRQKIIFALPGNPVSAFVSCFLFVLPVIEIMAGRPEPELLDDIYQYHHWIKVRLCLEKDMVLDERPEFLRAIVSLEETVPMARLIKGSQMSSRLMSVHGANALVLLPSGKEIPRISDQFIARAVMINF